jgi:hypothetical protein
VSDRSDSESDNTVDNVGYLEWLIRGTEYDAGIKGELKDTKNLKEIYKHFLDDKICELLVQQTNVYMQQKINEKYC